MFMKVIFCLAMVVAIRIVYIYFFHNKHGQVSTCSDVTPTGLWMFAVNEWMSYYCILWEHNSNGDNVYKFDCFTKITSNKWIIKSKRYCFTTMNHIVFLLPVSTIMYWQDKHQRMLSVSALRMVSVEWNADFCVTKKGKWPETNKFQAISIFKFFLDNVSVFVQRFASLLTVLLYSGW